MGIGSFRQSSGVRGKGPWQNSLNEEYQGLSYTLQCKVNAPSAMNETELMNGRKRWLVVFVYAVAMAWVEAAVVLYLRQLIGRIEPYQPYPLPPAGILSAVELAREAATLVMLLAVGILAGRTWRSRLGYAAVAFGVWDIFYYVFLKAICGWPHSVMDWDILFLIPLPWWGPVLAPVLISLLLIVWGTLASLMEQTRTPVLATRVATGLGAAGVALGLWVFMADAITAAPQGGMAIRNALPRSFHWPLFCGALLLMAAPAAQLMWTYFRAAAGLRPRRNKHTAPPGWPGG